MLIDLFHIHTKSIKNRKRYEQISFGELYNTSKLLERLSQIIPIIEQINQSPIVDLVRAEQQRSFYQVRNFDIKFELNRTMNPGVYGNIKVQKIATKKYIA